MVASVALLRSQAPGSPVAHWTLDEGMGVTTIADNSGNGHDGTRNNPGSTTGHIGGALQFNGSTDHVLVSGAAALEPTRFAISAWVKYTTTDVSGGDVLSMGDNYGLRVQPDGSVKSYYYKGASVWNVAVSTNVNTKDGQWHHIFGQYTGSHLQVYVDGIQRDSQPYPDAISYSLGTDLFIGHHGFGGSNHSFSGAIDQVRLYDRELMPSEIAALAAEGSPTSTSVKVLTWNLRKGRATDNSDSIADNSIADWIKNVAEADVLLLSAVQNATEATAIKNRLNAGGGTWDVYFAKAGDTTEGQAILSHYPMPAGLMPDGRPYRDQHEVSCPNDTENQVLVKAVVQIGGMDVNFFALDQQHGSARSAVRECQALGFSAWADTFAEPRIVGGDFNSTPGTLGITTWTDASYFDGWAEAISKVGYPAEGASKGNSATSTPFGRTRTNRIDYILTAPRLTYTEARVWLTRKEGTSCNHVNTFDGFLGSVCSGDCSACTFVDDKAVRPTDHVPLTVIMQIQ